MAANRNERVKGRTDTLVVSIKTRNGLSQSGAPSGRKWAIDALGAAENEDKIILNHRGNPQVKVKIKWLEILKKYGISPIKFINIIVVNKDEVNITIILKLPRKVRFSWAIISDPISSNVALVRFIYIIGHKWIITIIIILINKIKEVDGSVELNEIGSNEEKISDIIVNMMMNWSY